MPSGGPRELTLALAGDVMLGRGVDAVVREKGPEHAWGDVLPSLRGADLVLVNLECALTARTERGRDGGVKLFYFRSGPANVAALEAAGVNCATVANNHALDFGREGLLDTLRALDNAGIAHAGAGSNLESARAPARLERAGVRVAVVAFADYPPEWVATEASPGFNYTPVSTAPRAFEAVAGAVARARAAADFVVFSIHWGPNMRVRPPEHFKLFARAVLDAGADVFWGHSAHVLQGVEVYRGRPVLYDTGDFVDDYAVDPFDRNDLSALFLLRLAAEPPRVAALEMLPVRIADCQVNVARGADRAWVAGRLSDLCREMGTEVAQVPERLSVVMP